ncbi:MULTISPECIES: hypothetical protein [Paenibacillus]|uniref:Uncharacterized protein n=1 Tax=Paenibacillus oleatilyticus TaxID=2594886 RepID=A0ABV4VB64_9BACL|nr:hypothetical protein Elgi_00080 [Paenibacillus elgii]
MKKIASLALLSALSLTSIAGAAAAEQLTPNAINPTVAASEPVGHHELAAAGLVIKFGSVTGVHHYTVSILNTDDNSKQTFDTTSNSYTFTGAAIDTEYKLWVGAYDKSGRLLKQTDPNSNYVTYKFAGQSVSLAWK